MHSVCTRAPAHNNNDYDDLAAALTGQYPTFTFRPGLAG